jgi:hypothetical protein
LTEPDLGLPADVLDVVFASVDGSFTRPGEIANSFIFDCGDIDGGEITGAGQAGEWHSIPAVGFHLSARVLGDQRRGHHPALVAFCAQIPVELGATGAGFVDEDQMFGLGWHLADEVIDITVAGAHGAEEDDLGVVSFGDVGHGNRVFVDIHSNVQGARLVHG